MTTYEIIVHLYASDDEVQEAAQDVGVDAYFHEETNWGAEYALTGSLEALQRYFDLYCAGDPISDYTLTLLSAEEAI